MDGRQQHIAVVASRIVVARVAMHICVILIARKPQRRSLPGSRRFSPPDNALFSGNARSRGHFPAFPPSRSTAVFRNGTFRTPNTATDSAPTRSLRIASSLSLSVPSDSHSDRRVDRDRGVDRPRSADMASRSPPPIDSALFLSRQTRSARSAPRFHAPVCHKQDQTQRSLALAS